VGRIYEDRHSRPELRWFWSITVFVNPMLGIKTSGRAPSMDEAKAQYLTNWQKRRAEVCTCPNPSRFYPNFGRNDPLINHPRIMRADQYDGERTETSLGNPAARPQRLPPRGIHARGRPESVQAATQKFVATTLVSHSKCRRAVTRTAAPRGILTSALHCAARTNVSGRAAIGIGEVGIRSSV
jgi:hypothetical protein